MTTNDYIKELKSHLSVLDNDKKKNIIQEIESYIEESDVDYSVLVERFGKPDELANNYLEDMPIKEEKTKVLWSKTKKLCNKYFNLFICSFYYNCFSCILCK